MRRRTVLATGAPALGVPTGGCSAWLLIQAPSDQNSRDEQADASDSAADESPLGTSTDGDEDDDGTATADKDEESTDHSDAADPEPEPEVESGPEDLTGEGEATADDPAAAADVPIADASLQTTSAGAVVSGRALNDSEAPLTVDLAVTFLEAGREIGRPTLDGTTGL